MRNLVISIEDTNGNIIDYLSFFILSDRWYDYSTQSWINEQIADEPILEYEFVIEKYADDVITESGEIKTFIKGYRLEVRFTFTADLIQLRGERLMKFWKKVLEAEKMGYKIYFYPDYSGARTLYKYEVVLSEESKRKFIENTWVLVEGTYVFKGKKLLDNIPDWY
jgi:hypothetical protein